MVKQCLVFASAIEIECITGCLSESLVLIQVKINVFLSNVYATFTIFLRYDTAQMQRYTREHPTRVSKS